MEKPEKFYILCGFTDHICNTHGRPHKTYEEALQKAKDLVRSSHPHSDTFIIMESVACVQSEPPVEPPIHVSRYDETPTKVIHKELTRKEDTPKYHETQRKDSGVLGGECYEYYRIYHDETDSFFDEIEYSSYLEAMKKKREYSDANECDLSIKAFICKTTEVFPYDESGEGKDVKPLFTEGGLTTQGRIVQLENLLRLRGALSLDQQTELEKLKDQIRLEKMEEEK